MRKFSLILLLLATLSFICAVPREMVVVEVGTGTWCPYCPGASMGTHDLVENGYNVAVIKNQNGDAYANTYSNARNSYYGINSYPTAKFDGVLTYSGGSNTQSLYSVYLPLVNQRLAIPSAYTITAEGDLDGQVLTVDVTVTKVEADANTNVVLHSSITESNIQQNWQGQTELHNVNRLMSPNQNGTPVSLATGASTTISLTFNLSPQWQLPNLELVLWLQNVTSKEILQGKKYSVPGISGAFPASLQTIEFPQTYVGGLRTKPITFYNFGDDPVTASLASNSDSFIPEVANISIPALQSVTVDVHFIPTAAGDYSADLTVTGNFNQHPELNILMTGHAFINIAPVAEDVMLYGPPVYLQTLAGAYTYSDGDGDEEGQTEFKWFRIINDTPQEIPDANQITYTIQEADLGLPIAFGVVPVDTHGMPGAVAMSEASEPIINLPAPQNFEATLLPPDTAQLTWERPPYFEGRGFVGYRIFRNGLLISTITNPNNLSFNDTYLPDGTHEYWICSLFNNPMMLSDPSPSAFVTVGESDNEDQVNAIEFSLTAMPNPFQSNTSFEIKSQPNTLVKVNVFNLKGQLVKHWEINSDSSGQAFVDWDGRDQKGISTDSGIYLYRLEALGKSSTGKLIKLSN